MVVKIAIGFIVPKIGIAFSREIFTSGPIIPDRKAKKRLVKTHIIFFDRISPIDVEPINKPRAAPKKFAYIKSKRVILKSVIKGIFKTKSTKEIYMRLAVRLKII